MTFLKWLVNKFWIFSKMMLKFENPSQQFGAAICIYKYILWSQFVFFILYVSREIQKVFSIIFPAVTTFSWLQISTTSV